MKSLSNWLCLVLTDFVSLQLHTVQGDLMKETKNINKSLSMLSHVIEKLQEKNPKHIPFLNSKLTTLLQNSLTGNSKTLAIVCCNPHVSHYHESYSTLEFAKKCCKVELKAQAQVKFSG